MEVECSLTPPVDWSGVRHGKVDWCGDGQARDEQQCTLIEYITTPALFNISFIARSYFPETPEIRRGIYIQKLFWVFFTVKHVQLEVSNVVHSYFRPLF